MIELAEQGFIDQAMQILREKAPAKFLKSHVGFERSLQDMRIKTQGGILKYAFDKFTNVPVGLTSALERVDREKKSF